MNRIKYHVTYRKSINRWVVIRENGEHILSSHRFKFMAIISARQLAHEKMRELIPSQIIVHKKNGVIQTEWTYLDDPTETKG